MRNRFKGLDLIDRVPDELWNEVHDIVQETEKKCKKAKWLSGEALQKAVVLVGAWTTICNLKAFRRLETNSFIQLQM